MSIPTFELEDPESGSQQRLERRRELNRKAQRRFRTRRNQARIRQIEQDNQLATVWPNDWHWSSSSAYSAPLAAQNQTIEQASSFRTDEPLALDTSALDSMLYPTIAQGVPLMESPPLAPLQSQAMTALGDSQSLASHSSTATPTQDDGHHDTASAQQVYSSWVPDLSGLEFTEPQESVVTTDTGSPFMAESSVWSGMMDMSPSHSPDILLPTCIYVPAMASFDATISPVTTAADTTLLMDPQEELNWNSVEGFQAALSWMPAAGTYVQ
ncbi:hypothetical protein PG999_013554 [Apiospora kogelbergensis]|uniref:BZIP domain-containing protein n=1 Tax=Apiospora kogelbergensis TaxID=1337665 RepID=A0AAW0QFK7_9PEZI